jgi:hypothetical protein
MKIASACSTEKDIRKAIKACYAQIIEKKINHISWVGIYYTDEYESEDAANQLMNLFGKVPIHGGTSCMGVMSSNGFFSDNGRGMGIMAISDKDGCYGVGAANLGNAPEAAAQSALTMALASAGRDGEVPAMVLINAAPGHEEKLIQGIEDLIGLGVPIIGGSTADNTNSGRWRQLEGSQVYHDAIVVSVFFPSVNFHYAFHSGYDPTEKKGLVTKANGRLLMEIDNRPAIQVYDEWIRELTDYEILKNGSKLSHTAFSPLGRKVSGVDKVPYYKLSHPLQVDDEGALSLFTDIKEGEEIVLMTGSRDSLTTRASRVALSAIATGGVEPESVVGAIVFYCAGCMLAVQDQMDQVAERIDKAINHAPFLGLFTFGEQGCFFKNLNTHGNLMVSVVAFSSTPPY